jgi:hypothetical protein
MYHEFNTLSRNPGAQSRPARNSSARSDSRSSRRAESANLGFRCNGRQMEPAALRVLETTRRVWREPLA